MKKPPHRTKLIKEKLTIVKGFTIAFLFVFGLSFSANTQPANYYHVEITVYDCLDSIVPNAQVTLDQVPTPNKAYLLEHYFTLSDSNGLAVFDSVLYATYNLTVYKQGYDTFVGKNIEIFSDYSATVHLMPFAYPPHFFIVDSLTSVATWKKPMEEFVPFEDFEDEQFPPPGWQTFGVFPYSRPWIRSNDGGSSGFPIPPGDGYYAVSNSDAAGSGSDGTAYLITPQFDLRGTDYCMLEFRSFFTAWYGEIASVEYSVDTGNTWEIINYMIPHTDWIYDSVNLSQFTGPEGESNIIIGFHADDQDNFASGWAIDNVWIHGHFANPSGYYVYLDNQIIDVIDHDTNRYTYQGLNWGQTYTGGLQAIYPCRTSETQEYTWTSAFLYPPQNFSCQYGYGSDEILAMWTPPLIVASDSNSNLLSFNIYVDDSLYMNYPYQGEPAGDTISCILDSVPVGLHQVKASALYELSNYGFPGQIGESMFTDTSFVYLTYGHELPFSEGWNHPYFSFNNWTVNENGATCTIDQNTGIPPASASFDIISDSSQYFTTLTSTILSADKIIDGDIFLDFNLKLETNNPSPSEHFKAEVFNGFEWKEYLDVVPENSFSFINYHFDITSDSKHRVFKIRFSVSGDSCNTNTHWNLDNIKVYRKCSPPENLTGEYFWKDTLGQELFGTKLSWTSPEITPEYFNQWIHWNNFEHTSSYNYHPENSISAAQRWDKYMFYNWNGLNLDGYYFKKIKIFIANADTVIAKIWTGNNANQLIWSSDTIITNRNSWNEIDVNETLTIDPKNEYWIGYTAITSSPPIFIGAVLSLSPTNNYGNLVLRKNRYIWKTYPYDNAIEFLAVDSTQQNKRVTVNNTGNRSFQHFNIYRKTDNQTYYSLYTTIPYIPDTLSYVFYDLYPNVTINNGYYYKVTAVWEDYESCESEPAHSLYIPNDDFVYVFITGSTEHDFGNGTTVYPNPAHRYFHVKSNSEIKNVSLYNISGRKIKDYPQLTGKQIKIDVLGIPSGTYIIKIATDKKTITKKIIIH